MVNGKKLLHQIWCGFSWQQTTAAYHSAMPSDEVFHSLGKTDIPGLEFKSKELKFTNNLMQFIPWCSSPNDTFGVFCLLIRWIFCFCLKPEEDSETNSQMEETKNHSSSTDFNHKFLWVSSRNRQAKQFLFVPHSPALNKHVPHPPLTLLMAQDRALVAPPAVVSRCSRYRPTSQRLP